MKSCDGCGVWEVFADLKRIPPAFLCTHPMDNPSSDARWLCVDERGCVRRSRMKMQPDKGIVWGYESIRHVLIHCKACGAERTAQGIREIWIEGDPFPDHAYVCSQCGAEYLREKWVDLESVKKPICRTNQQGVPNHCWWDSVDHCICATCCHCHRFRLPNVDPERDLRSLFR